jgi:tRNA nucleotidyltransferase (CCA-adding enzyme)
MRVDERRLIGALPPDVARAVGAASRLARRRGGRLWVVGGAIRDHIAGIPLRDADLATDLDAAALAVEVAGRLDAVASGWPRFGTASIALGEHRVDIATLRTERYPRPGALPVVHFDATIEQDLARRDFSVNAIALELGGRGEAVDPFAGLDDLRARRLRVLHPRSFRDDATRLWRGARYAARLDLHPDAETARLIEAGGAWLRSISGERIWAEFERTAAERRPGRVLARLDAWGVLRSTHPALRYGPAARRGLARRRSPLDAARLLAVMLAGEAGRAGAYERLNAPTEARRAVEDATRLLDAPPEAARDIEALHALESTGAAGREAARMLAPETQRPLQAALRRWERTRPHLDAAALVRVGVAPGPALGVWLRRLRAERYLGNLSSASEARRLIRRERAALEAATPPRGTTR